MTMRRLVVLLAMGSACLTNVDLGGTVPAVTDAGGQQDSSPPSCGSLVAPSAPAPCNACSPQFSDCQANGCYNGWFCDVAARYCRPPPTSCDAAAPYEGGFGFDAPWFD